MCIDCADSRIMEFPNQFNVGTSGVGVMVRVLLNLVLLKEHQCKPTGVV